MEENVGKTDKIVRIVLGALLAYYWYTADNVIAGAAALILLATALTGKCGIYKVFGVNTCKV